MRSDGSFMLLIILHFHAQIEVYCNELDSNNITHVYIQAKTAKAVE